MPTRRKVMPLWAALKSFLTEVTLLRFARRLEGARPTFDLGMHYSLPNDAHRIGMPRACCGAPAARWRRANLQRPKDMAAVPRSERANLLRVVDFNIHFTHVRVYSTLWSGCGGSAEGAAGAAAAGALSTTREATAATATRPAPMTTPCSIRFD